MHLSLNEDLLKTCKFQGKKIGFKMEFDSQNALENAKKSLKDKQLDMVCLNIIDQKIILEAIKMSFILSL